MPAFFSLKCYSILKTSLGRYSYQITCEGGSCAYSVSDGTSRISVPILWAFGSGNAGQTYIFRHNGEFIQSRVSFYSEIRGLDATLGSAGYTPKTLDDALGAVIDSSEAPECLGCHTTGAISEGKLTAGTHPKLGISCESCHGPGAQHIAASSAGRHAQPDIFNPAILSAGDLEDFCGACHRTWMQVQLMGIRDARNVRFQPYRLQNSRCWDAEDLRISCVACHDPHGKLEKNPAFYDAKCLACHSSMAKAQPRERFPGPACSVSSHDCVTCHMPKVGLPGSHFKFSDHWIRIARAGEPYPP